MSLIVEVNRQWRAVSEPAFSPGFNIEKFDETVPVRSSSVEIVDGDGEYDVPVTRGARKIRIAGYVVADSPDRLDAYELAHRAVLADGAAGQVTIARQFATVRGSAKLGDYVSFDRTFKSRADFDITFKFDDPRLYGKLNRFPLGILGVPVFHRGNYPAIPIITVSGSGSNDYSIYGPDGKQYRVTQDLVAGHPHVIDLRTGQLSIDGVVIFGGVTIADTWAIPGGRTVTCSFDPNGNSATATLALRETYF